MTKKNHKISLIFIINAQDISIEVNVEAPLIEAVQRALAESDNAGHLPDGWEVRDVDGVLIEMNRTPKELGLHEGTRIFLSHSAEEGKLTLIFIINGQDFPIEANAQAQLIEAVQRALAESNNTGRPPDEWEVRDASGVLLEKNRTPKDLGLHEGVRLFLSLSVGAGGIDQSRP